MGDSNMNSWRLTMGPVGPVYSSQTLACYKPATQSAEPLRLAASPIVPRRVLVASPAPLLLHSRTAQGGQLLPQLCVLRLQLHHPRAQGLQFIAG